MLVFTSITAILAGTLFVLMLQSDDESLECLAE